MNPAKKSRTIFRFNGTSTGQQGTVTTDQYYASLGSLGCRPVLGPIVTVLTSLSSVLTIMPVPVQPTNPWAQDIAALKGDMATIGRDAWAVIARYENERRRQDG